MPAMTYPPATPPESRWDWYMRVPDAWRSYPVTEIMRYAAYLLDYYDLTHDGGPAEIASTKFNNDWYFLVKSDVDPATVVDMQNLPPVPKSAEQVRTERLRAAQTVYAGGGTLTAAQIQEALRHLIDAYMAEVQ